MATTTTAEAQHAARSKGPSVQSILSIESRVPDVLLYEDYTSTGTEDVSIEGYVSADWHKREVQYLWRDTWQMACREEEIPKAGDCHIYEIARDSIIISRQPTGEIKAFYNACLHRGRQLRDEDGNVSAFRCPFHGFTWNLDGSLAVVPSEWDFSHIDMEKFSLPEVAVDTWGGFVFLHLGTNPEPLSEFLGPLPDHFEPYPLDDRYISVHVAKVMPSNWKLVMEAFIESFHVMATHAQLMLFVGDENAQYDNFGERFNFNRTIIPHAVPSPHLDGVIDDGDIIANAKDNLGLDATAEFAKGLGARAAIAEADRRLIQERTGVNLVDRSDAELIDTIQYFVFPNFVPWANFGTPYIFRFRPNGDDYETSIMDLYLLQPIPSGAERPAPAPVEELSIDQPWTASKTLAPGTAIVFEQDTSNLRAQQKGLTTTRKPGITLGDYQESRIRHLHALLESKLSGLA